MINKLSIYMNNLDYQACHLNNKKNYKILNEKTFLVYNFNFIIYSNF